MCQGHTDTHEPSPWLHVVTMFKPIVALNYWLHDLHDSNSICTQHKSRKLTRTGNFPHRVKTSCRCRELLLLARGNACKALLSASISPYLKSPAGAMTMRKQRTLDMQPGRNGGHRSRVVLPNSKDLDVRLCRKSTQYKCKHGRLNGASSGNAANLQTLSCKTWHKRKK